ncbi:hypothetical protein IFM89_021426 [Coptis chinensis]|uniref:Uncharacterized protein n=1 Tax=Coptis chinensis TaxID=261450 RepID=A0A835I593_9MAGN|nr:hypothetical protein IFM89_021426 [Coptis chinensis]
MDAEMAFLMANQALHAFSTLNEWSLYGLPMPVSLLRADNNLPPWRPGLKEVFDAIIYDPPYGVCVGGRKSGGRKLLKGIVDPYTVPDDKRLDHVPSTAPYSLAECIHDLFELAARMLVMGGRLVFFYPVLREDGSTDTHFPEHPCFIEEIADAAVKMHLDFRENHLKWLEDGKLHSAVFSPNDSQTASVESKLIKDSKPKYRGKRAFVPLLDFHPYSPNFGLNYFSNIMYGLPMPVSLLRADNNLPPWRPGLKRGSPLCIHVAHLKLCLYLFSHVPKWCPCNATPASTQVFDAIIYDPPYGVCAGGRKSGARKLLKGIIDPYTVPDGKRLDHVPSTAPYSLAECIHDLFELAARMLVMGGRLVFFYPVYFAKLLTMVKKGPYSEEIADVAVKMHLDFRENHLKWLEDGKLHSAVFSPNDSQTASVESKLIKDSKPKYRENHEFCESSGRIARMITEEEPISTWLDLLSYVVEIPPKYIINRGTMNARYVGSCGYGAGAGAVSQKSNAVDIWTLKSTAIKIVELGAASTERLKLSHQCPF